MSKFIHLWQEEIKEIEDEIIIEATVEEFEYRYPLWYRLPLGYRSQVSQSCNPFVLATLFLAMNKKANLVVHGEVSPSLLQHLVEFQVAWSCWNPRRYQQVDIRADVERESQKIEASKRVISTFSGGVDSCFTAWRHCVDSESYCNKKQQINLEAAIMVHGFDIPLEQKEVFQRAADKSKRMLESLGVELIPVTTNFRDIKQDWEDAHGAGIASCLSLFEGTYNFGLIPSGPSYKTLVFPLGSNPITDPMLSSQNFQIIHDGTGFSRLEKIDAIAQWKEARENLRVCWEGSQLDRNCGKCEKCLRTILSFRALGAGLPGCFEQDVSDRAIVDIKVRKAQLEVDFVPILNLAKASNLSDSWVTALETSITRNRRRLVREDRIAAFKKQIPRPVKRQWQKLRSRLKTKKT